MNVHSLSPAVFKGTISAEAAFCGLQVSDLRNLDAAGFGSALVLVRLRSAYADARQVMSVHALLAWHKLGHFITVDGSDFVLNDIRDVMAVATAPAR